MKTVIRRARLVTADGPAGIPLRGRAMSALRVIPSASLWIKDGLIAGIERDLGEEAPEGWREIDAAGRVVMPGFVDCHTHTCFAGDRLDEWEMKRRGVPYLDILKAGCGIMSTVRAVRSSTREQLAGSLLQRLNSMLDHGATTVEVKSGYGLSTDDELKMLRAVRDVASRWAGTVVATALLGHAIDGDAAAFVEKTIRETLPAVTAEFPGIAIDAFCEQGAWSLADCTRLFEKAVSLGHPIRVHADQFNAMGMLDAALRLGARSVDHLEASTTEGLSLLAKSPSTGVLLPCCGLHVDGRYANGRSLIDHGGAVAVATNFNPGSAPCPSMPMAAALAVRNCGLSPAEAVSAITANAASVLGLGDRGRLDVGMRADIVILRHADERMLVYEFGSNCVDCVIVGGRVIRHSP